MNLLLINNTIPGLTEFIGGINSETKYVVYDNNVDTFNGILDQISAFGVDSFANMAFVFENKCWGNEVFLENTNFISSLSKNNYDELGNLISITQEVISNQSTEFIKTLVEKYQINTIDFLACSLLGNESWRNYFNFLTVDSSIKIRASDDNTGNLNSGGDWILESTGEDVSLLYFNSKINYWTYLLGIIPPLSTNNTVLAIAYDTISPGVYVGGTFTNIDVSGTNRSVNKIAKYDLSTDTWSRLGADTSFNGIEGTEVRTIYVDNSGIVYAGGLFSGVYDASNTLKTSTNVAKYNPNTKLWTPLTGLTGATVRSIQVKDSNKYIFAGGDFGSSGPAYFSYNKNDGTAWVDLGWQFTASQGAGKPGPVYRVRMDNSENYLYVGGTFSKNTNSGTSYNGLMKFDISTNNNPTNVSPAGGIGGGVDTNGATGLNTMRYYKDNSNNEYLYIGGNFSNLGASGSKAPFARYNLTSNVWDMSYASNTWTSSSINTIDFDSSGFVYVGGSGFTKAGNISGGNQLFRFVFDVDASGNSKIKDGSGIWQILGGGVSGASASVNTLSRLNSNILVGGSFNSVDANVDVRNIAFYIYDNSLTDLSANYSGSSSYDVIDNALDDSIDLKPYLQKNLPVVAKGKETKFQNYVKGKTGKFKSRFADISGYYLTQNGGNAYGFYTQTLSGKDMSGINLRYTIPDKGYNGNGGGIFDASNADVSYIYVPVTYPEDYQLRIKGKDMRSFNFKNVSGTLQLNYTDNTGSTSTATIGTTIPLLTANYDNSKNLWLDSVRVIGWGSNAFEYSSGTFFNCITEDTDILTPSGYVNVQLLADGCEVINDRGKKVKIKSIQTSIIRGNQKNNPYIIKKNSIEHNYPSCDVKISGEHLIKYKNQWISPAKCDCFEQDESKEYITYYHIELEDYEDNLVVSGGLIIESLTHRGKPGAQIRAERLKNLYFPKKKDIKLDK